MNTILKFFFYSVALGTLAWVHKAPAEAVTMIEWVRLVQSPSAAILVMLFTALLLLANIGLTAMIRWAYSKGQ